MGVQSTKFYIVQTHSYDGEAVVEVSVKQGPFPAYEDAHEAFQKVADAYEGYDDATIDEENDGVVFYDGQNGIYNLLIMEVPAEKE